MNPQLVTTNIAEFILQYKKYSLFYGTKSVGQTPKLKFLKLVLE